MNFNEINIKLIDFIQINLLKISTSFVSISTEIVKDSL